MTFATKAWANGNILDYLSLIDLETRLSAYTDLISNKAILVSNVKSLGALGDARTVTDAAMTTGTNIVTSATAAFTSADVGKTCTVQQALTSVSSVVAIIQSVTNSTTAVLSVTATRTVSGVYAMIGTRNNTPIINACTQAGVGGTVYIPPGIYLTTGNLDFSFANQTIVLARGATLLSDGSAVRPFRIGADGMTFCGEGTIDGNWAGMASPSDPAPTILMTISPHHWISILDITIQNGPLYGLGMLNSNHITIIGTKILNIGVQSINVGGASGIDYQIKDNHIDNTMVDGTLPASAGGVNGSGISCGSNNSIVCGNVIFCPPATTSNLSANSQGIIGTFNDSVISNNIVEGARIGYSPASSQGLSFTGNTVKGSKDYGFEFPDLTFGAVTGNTCNGLGVTTVGIIFDGGQTGAPAAFSTVTGNTVRGVIGTGISTTNALSHHITVGDNYVEISGTGTIGIYVRSSSRCIVNSNMVLGSAGSTRGILSENCSNTTIIGNQCYGFTNPIYLNETTPQTRAQLIIIGNQSDNALTVVKSANLTYGTGCNINNNGSDLTYNGGISISTPGAVTSLNIAHGLTGTPTKFQIQSGDANSRGAPSYYVTATSTNIIPNFASALSATLAYTWNWRAEL